MFRQVFSECLVHGSRILKHAGKVGLQEHNIRPTLVPLVVPPSHSSPKVVLRPHFIPAAFLNRSAFPAYTTPRVDAVRGLQSVLRWANVVGGQSQSA